jgi:hypothetical protein
MNYIYLIRDWMAVMREDDRLKTQHLALYMTLFQEWNSKFFRNPIVLKRDEIMQQACIGSKNFYLKTMKELDLWGYLHYKPSYDPRQGSRVYLHAFDTGSDTAADTGEDPGGGTAADTGEDPGGGTAADTGGDTATDTGGGTGRETIYTNNTNSINKLNGINAYGTSNENSDFVDNRGTDAYAQTTGPGNHLRKKQTSGGRGGARGHDIPATVQETQEYFLTEHSTADEAEKFCNHYQANGWLVGGRTPMQDWRAAARNWIKNAKKFAHENRNAQPKPGPLNNGPKNYAEPL